MAASAKDAAIFLNVDLIISGRFPPRFHPTRPPYHWPPHSFRL